MSGFEHSDRAYMTPLLNRIADVAGERAALLIGSEKAGEKVYIGKQLERDNWLVELVGDEAAHKIAKVFGPQTVLIPAALNGQRRQTSKTIAQMIDKGASNNDIVRATGVSRRTVTYHRRRRSAPNNSPKDDDQDDLF